MPPSFCPRLSLQTYFLQKLTLIVLFPLSVLALPSLLESKGPIGCQTLSLPWSEYTAIYDPKNEICSYQNIRFAQAPIGPLRFRAPQDPEPGYLSPKEQISCIQVDPTRRWAPTSFFRESESCTAPKGIEDEDCLFLDLYVPLAAFNTSQPPLPVVVWLYGGGFVYGSKSEFDFNLLPLYDGKGPINAASGGIIFVAGNYRLGAFGWMAGSFLESQPDPMTNVGLRDQRKVFEFVRDYIYLVNGDKSQVSAWGESAGASSILHHLVADYGNEGPLFSKAILQSPAFQWQWDRAGTLNDTYTTIAQKAGCLDASIECLQNVSMSDLALANQDLFQRTTGRTGVFPLGPSLDGSLIKELPAVAFPAGRHAKLDSIIISHVDTEVTITGDAGFIPPPIHRDPFNTTNFANFLSAFIPGPSLASLRHNISLQYPSSAYDNNNQELRAAHLIQDAVFASNARLLFDAYTALDNTPTYMLAYAVYADQGAAVHASDLLPTFWNSDIDLKALLTDCVGLGSRNAAVAAYYLTRFAPAYQSYLTSHARTRNGNPNSQSKGWARSHEWGIATPDNETGGVRDVLRTSGNWFRPFVTGYTDPFADREACDFWTRVAGVLQRVSDKGSGGRDGVGGGRFVVQDEEGDGYGGVYGGE